MENNNYNLHDKNLESNLIIIKFIEMNLSMTAKTFFFYLISMIVKCGYSINRNLDTLDGTPEYSLR